MKNNLAVLLIDMQNGFLQGRRNDVIEDLIANQKSLLQYCAEHDWPVAITLFANQGFTIPELQTLVNQVPRHNQFIKPGRNGFENYKLREQLESWGSEHLLLTGIDAYACVNATGKHAVDTLKLKVSSSWDLANVMDRGWQSSCGFDCLKQICIHYPKTYSELLDRCENAEGYQSLLKAIANISSID